MFWFDHKHLQVLDIPWVCHSWKDMTNIDSSHHEPQLTGYKLITLITLLLELHFCQYSGISLVMLASSFPILKISREESRALSGEP